MSLSAEFMVAFGLVLVAMGAIGLMVGHVRDAAPAGDDAADGPDADAVGDGNSAP